MALNKIDSRGVYSLVAPEVTHGVFPAGATWRKLDLNSYSDASSSYESTPREVMDGSRQARKGKQSSKEVSFGYNIDVTKSNSLAQVASFLYNTPKEKFTTRSAFVGSPLTTVVTNLITAITDTTITTTATVAASLKAGDIIVVEDGVNDRVPLVVVTAVTTVVTFAKLNPLHVIKVVSPLTDARIIKVGVKAAAGDMVLASTATAATLTTAAGDFVAMGLSRGEWIFVGGDDAAFKFASTPPFYARIFDVKAKVLTFDTTTSPIVADVGAATTLALFFGTFIVNGDTRTSYTHARHLGKNEAGKTLVETFTGCVPNEMGVSLSEASYVQLDLGYMAKDHRPTTMTTPEFTAAYTKVKEPPEEDAFHTSSDLYRQRLSVDGVALNTAAITSFVQEASISITNNLSADTALGQLGAFDFSVGNFGLTGSITAYFIGLEAIDAVRCNCTVGMDLILATKNSGIVVDMPSFTLGGNIEVEANASIKIALEQAAFRSSKFGYMLSWTSFPYLPAAAMPNGLDACDC